nr:UDP-N-acetylmuramate dehydrogenase [uncultured Sellimonas sp.]
MNKEFYEKLCGCTAPERVKEQEPMAGHTTFRIGGAADYYVSPADSEEVGKLIRLCSEEQVPYYIVGNGSNLLVSDQGYRGVIIAIGREMSRIEVEGCTIRAQAGALMSQIAAAALEHGLAGFEFASGIPGTIGGAAVMNAGAYGGEMKDVIEEVTAMDAKGSTIVLSKDELEFGYRTSLVMKKKYIVLEVCIGLEQGAKEEIREKMEDFKQRRISKQPLEYPSAGSTFKRPEGYFAGKLIQDTGLRGFTVGGAQVSEKHSGFVINKGGASAEDVNRLMQEVSDRVYEKFGVRLEPEVRRLGEFGPKQDER